MLTAAFCQCVFDFAVIAISMFLRWQLSICRYWKQCRRWRTLC